jgi:hypothetical protein
MQVADHNTKLKLAKLSWHKDLLLQLYNTFAQNWERNGLITESINQ